MVSAPRAFSIERIVMPRRYSLEAPEAVESSVDTLGRTARRRRDSSPSGLRTTTSMNSRVSIS
jgi:hypothetical protein